MAIIFTHGLTFYEVYVTAAWAPYMALCFESRLLYSWPGE